MATSRISSSIADPGDAGVSSEQVYCPQEEDDQVQEISNNSDSDYASCSSSFYEDADDALPTPTTPRQPLQRYGTWPLCSQWATGAAGLFASATTYAIRENPRPVLWNHTIMRHGMAFYYSSLTLSSSQTLCMHPNVCAIKYTTGEQPLVAGHDLDGITISEDMRLGERNLESGNTSPAPDHLPHAHSGPVLHEHKRPPSDYWTADMPALLASDSTVCPSKGKKRPLRLIGSIPPSTTSSQKSSKPRRRGFSFLGWQVKRLTIDPKPAPHAWHIGGLLGSGTYGRVFHVYNKLSGTELAMKAIDIRNPLPGTTCDGLMTELMVLDTLALSKRRLPFLLYPTTKRSWAWRSSEKFMFMLTELCTGGELWQYSKQLNGPTLRLVIAELILGIEALHGLGIAHHDLKPENVLVDGEGHCVIADYGGAKFIASNGTLRRSVYEDILVTAPYAAPELLTSDGYDEDGFVYYDATVDWWALGALIVTLVTGEEYFYRDNTAELVLDVPWLVECLPDTLKSYGCSDDLIDVVTGFLQIDPTERARAPSIKSHRYFRKIDWELLEQRSSEITSPFLPRRTVTYESGRGFGNCPASQDEAFDFVEDLHFNGIDLELDDTFSMV